MCCRSVSKGTAVAVLAVAVIVCSVTGHANTPDPGK